MRIYHGEVKTINKAEFIAANQRRVIEEAGGQIVVGVSPDVDAPAILMVMLPDDLSPSKFIDGVDFYEVHAMHVPQVPDQGIRE